MSNENTTAEFVFADTGLERNAGKDFARLEEGIHQGIIVGAIQRSITGTDGVKKSVVEFLIQVAEGEEIHYIRTKSLSSMYLYTENSNFCKMLKGLTQVATTDDPNYIPRLTTLGIVRNEKVNPSHFLGLNIQITTTDNLRSNGKTYPEIFKYKSSQAKEIAKVDEISEKLLDFDGSLQGKILVPQITVKPKSDAKPALAVAPAPKPAPVAVTKPADDDDWANS